MIRTPHESAERLLVRAHTIRLLAHGSAAVTEQAMLHLHECIGRFEASLLLSAPESVVAECRRRLDAQIDIVEVRLRSPESPTATTVGAWATRGMAAR